MSRRGPLLRPVLSRDTASGVATGLGWFSIGLGLAELLAPRTLARCLGMRGAEGLLRFYGLREIGAGVGILLAREAGPWLWGRVAGDALDIATLATGLEEDNPRRGNVMLALGAVGAVTALDIVCAQSLSVPEEDAPRQPAYDYSDRSGLPRSPDEMRGAARDAEIPDDMRAPEALRPWRGNGAGRG
ncbi:MAG: cyclase dehydrase [Dongiaceae bacterium]